MSTCVLDTDVVIAASIDAMSPPAAEAVLGMIEDGVELRTSTVNYAEALARPAENKDTLRARARRLLRSQVLRAMVELGRESPGRLT